MSGDVSIHSDRPAAQLRRLAVAGMVAIVAAVAANLILFLIVGHVFDVSFVMMYPGSGTTAQPLPAWMVAGVSAVTALTAAGLLSLLIRFLARPWRIFVATAVVVLLVSFVGPLSLTGVSVGTRLALISMHLAAAAVIVGVLSQLAGVRPGLDRRET